MAAETLYDQIFSQAYDYAKELPNSMSVHSYIEGLSNDELLSKISDALEIRLAQFRKEIALDSMFAVGFR